MLDARVFLLEGDKEDKRQNALLLKLFTFSFIRYGKRKDERQR